MRTNSTTNHCTGLILPQQNNANCNCLGRCSLSLHSLLKALMQCKLPNNPYWHKTRLSYKSPPPRKTLSLMFKGELRSVSNFNSSFSEPRHLVCSSVRSPAPAPCPLLAVSRTSTCAAAASICVLSRSSGHGPLPRRCCRAKSANRLVFECSRQQCLTRGF